MRKNKISLVGRLMTNNVVLELHEYATINVLLANGMDVELIEKSRTPHTKSADIIMLGMTWEIKSPNGKTIRCIERAFRRATHQAPNIIIDLRRINFSDIAAMILLKRLFKELHSVRNLWIITKKSEIVKLKK